MAQIIRNTGKVLFTGTYSQACGEFVKRGYNGHHHILPSPGEIPGRNETPIQRESLKKQLFNALNPNA